MDNDSLLAEIYAELGRTKIGERFSPRSFDHKFHQAAVKALVRAQTRSFAEDLAALPQISFTSPEVQELGIGPPDCWAIGPDGRATYRRGEVGGTAIYWNGEALDARPYPGWAEVWADEFLMFADHVLKAAAALGPEVTVLELGSGAGSVTFHLIARARARGQTGLRFVNVDRDSAALAFSSLFTRRHGLPVEHILMDLGTSLDHREDMAEFARRVGRDRPTLVITHASLHPYYNEAQYERLFPFIVDDLAARAGIHLERCGFRTPEFARLIEQVGTDAYPIRPRFRDQLADPLVFLTEHAGALGITIQERIAMVPHFPPRTAPSFLRWTRG